MGSNQSKRVAAFVRQAMELAVGDRSAFLDRSCGTDAELRAAVEQQLTRAEQAAGTRGRPEHLPVPQRIGPYQLVEVVGEGAMGIVYRAVQQEPIRREVAIKVLRCGVVNREVITRFESELQTLALMNHPNIATVLDAGITENGLPYFAMEFVDGRPIQEVCDAGCLTIAERLDLLKQVCNGVQHAHRNAIIHRDLKPSNILVTYQDGVPVPKIIDFGIAKAVDCSPAPATGPEPGPTGGTLAYMSPEQTRSNGTTVDTRTDVYALGILLYELLVGRVPFAVDVMSADPAEARRRIREEAPRRPSDWLAAGGLQTSNVVDRRGTTVESLARRLRGDLDSIVLKAIEKDPGDRYGSPEELAADIGRHLGHWPVVAMGPGLAYRTRKFTMRHRTAVATTLAFVAIVSALGGSMAAQAGRVKLERDRADQQTGMATTVSDFLVGLLQVGSPTDVRFDHAAPEDILRGGVEKLGQLEGQPVLHGRMLLTMGELHRKMGLHGRAGPILEEARDRLVEFTGPEDPAALDASISLARLYADTGRYDEAEPLFVAALEGRRRILGEGHTDTCRAAKDLAMMYKFSGRYREAEATMQEAVKGIRAANGEGHEQLLLHRALLAGIYIDLLRYEEAEEILVEIREDLSDAVGERHLESLAVAYNLGCVHANRGETDEALRLIGEAVDGGFFLGKSLFEDLHLEPLHGMPEFERIAHRMMMNAAENRRRMHLQAKVLDLQGRHEEARAAYVDVLEGQGRALGDDDPVLLDTRYDIITTYASERRWDALEEHAQVLLSDAARLRGEDGWLFGDVRWLLAGSKAAQGRMAEAHELCEQSLDFYRDGGYTRALLHWVSACCHAIRGERAVAIRELEQSYDLGLSESYWLTDEPMLGTLRDDPRFNALVEQMWQRPFGQFPLPMGIEPASR